MKYFLSGSVIIILILIALFGYRQNIFSYNTLPYDDEQHGLDDQIIINFSHVVAENTPKGMAAEKFAQLVEEKSEGRVIVKIYPNGMLYNDETEIEALRENEIQMIAPTFSKMTDLLPNWQVLDLPFIIDNNEELKTVLTGPLSEKLLQELNSINIKGLTFWNNGFKQIASTSPIINVEDFYEKRVRMMPSNILKQQFLLLGAEPIPTSFGNVYYDLQNKQVDAQENTISNIYSKRFYTMENHITLSNHGILCYAVMMNEDFWNNLDEDIKAIILQSLEEIQDWQFEQAQQMNEKELNSLMQMKDVKIYKLQDSDRKQWKAKIQPIYEVYRKQYNENYLNEFLEELKKEQIIK